MKLQLKLSLIFSLAIVIGMVMWGYRWHNFLHKNAAMQVMKQARLMMQSSLSARTYTAEQIDPLLDLGQEFRPQSIPNYAQQNLQTVRDMLSPLVGPIAERVIMAEAAQPTNMRQSCSHVY